jgi:hypothetical protein
MSHPKNLPAMNLFASKRPLPEEPRTVVCFGTPRGGTSMVAGTIVGLGVFMGHNLLQNIEDPMFNPDTDKALSWEAFKTRLPSVIDERNNSHQIWGWKFPLAHAYLDEIVTKLRNPHFVIVHRDPVPATLRSNLNDDQLALQEMLTRTQWTVNNLKFSDRVKAPTLMVSYERATKNPEGLIMQLADFLQLPLPSDISPILAFMEPGSYKKPIFQT